MTAPDLPQSAAPQDVEGVAADLNLRFAQLDWPVVAEARSGPGGRPLLLVRLTSGTSVAPLRVGPDLLARANLVPAVLEEVRARGWTSPAPHPTARADLLWCAPA